MKVKVTYRAPKGDSKVVEWGAFTFFDGVPVTVEQNDANAHMLSKIANNQHFEVGGVAGPVGSPTPVPQEPEVFPEEGSDDEEGQTPDNQEEAEVQGGEEEGGEEKVERSRSRTSKPARSAAKPSAAKSKRPAHRR